jgi:signal transduction histidine kinase
MAYAVRYLSRGRRYNHPQSAFLAGLLHNVGLLAMALVAPDAVQSVLDANCGLGSLAEEKKRLGTTHTTVGGQLAKRWGLPGWLTGVVRWHHQSPGGVPADLIDPVLVEMIREADEAIAGGEFGLSWSGERTPAERPVKRSDPMRYCVIGGVRQTTSFLNGHPLGNGAQDSDKWLEQLVGLSSQNATLQSEFGWQCRAWEGFRRLPPDASAADLTALIAETFHEALRALAVACYVRNADGTAAEGTFCCDGSRTITCPIEPGGSKPHSEQVVARLRAAWHQRPYRVIGIDCADETIAHVLVWIDEYAPAPCNELIQSVRSLCESWIEKVSYIAELESQIDSFEETLRSQAADAVSRLEQAKLAALAEMAAGAGHEFNNPLAVISGRAQLLLTEETDPRRRKALETIIGQTQRVHRMIVDLMFFARPPVPERKPVAVTEIVDRALAAVQRDAERLKVTLTATVPPNLPSTEGDIAQLASAIECIVQNSLEATPENGSVQIAVEPGERGTIQFKISDTGRGITDDQRQHIFEPFYSGREAGRGLGMGLPKAWRIVQNHQGEIVVPSTMPDGGTTVIVRLPAVAADAQQRACA